MSNAIPFFSDIPIKAIPAVQQLFDEVQAPGYSLSIVYSNLVSRLNSAGVTPPVRKLVTQWLAACKIGMASRPEMPAGIPGPNPALAPVPGYFENLPIAAMPALTSAWDAIQAATGVDDDGDADERAFDVFFDAVRAVGHMEPSWRGFVAYAKGVRSGHIARPGTHVVEDALATEPPATEEASLQGEAEPKRRGRRAKADVLVVDPTSGEAVQPEIVTEMDQDARAIVSARVEIRREPARALDTLAFVPLTPSDFRSAAKGKAALDPIPQETTVTLIDDAMAKEGVASALRSFRDELIDITYASLQADLRRRAEGIVAGQLRAMADEMELGGA